MNPSEEQLQSLMRRVEERERTTRRRAIIYTLVPVLLAGTLLSFTGYRMIQARRELAKIREEADRHQEKVDRHKKEAAELQLSLAKAKIELGQSTNLIRHVFQVDWINTKFLATRYPKQSELLFYILRMKDSRIGWKLDSSSPKVGFDSPSFAAYVLKEKGLLDVPFSERYRLREMVTPTRTPEVGDLIFYDIGYTMFYFKDESGHPFCVGMTPVGIIALEIQFGPRILGYGTVRY